MGMTDQNDLRVAVFEADLLDAFLDSGEVFAKIGIDQDVSLRCVYKVNGEIRRPNPVQITRDLKCGKWLVPVCLCQQRDRRKNEAQHQSPDRVHRRYSPYAVQLCTLCY